MALAPTSSFSGSQGLAADARSLNALKFGAGEQSPAAVKEAAKQFESLFMRELLKSMREATMKSGLMDGPGGDLGTDLLDQQFAVQMSGLKGGLSDMIAQQLSRQIGGGTLPDVAPKLAPATTPLPAPAPPATRSQSGFVQQHSEVAARVERATGIPASFMVGQAGHETGWGKKEIRHADGSNSHNLFGIKATSGWTGKVATITTTEYINGEPRKVQAKFRAYDSYEDSFRDYARMINESPRYAQARERTHSAVAFATELQRAGYATDPAYASKLSRAINSTLQLQRALT